LLAEGLLHGGVTGLNLTSPAKLIKKTTKTTTTEVDGDDDGSASTALTAAAAPPTTPRCPTAPTTPKTVVMSPVKVEVEVVRHPGRYSTSPPLTQLRLEVVTLIADLFVVVVADGGGGGGCGGDDDDDKDGDEKKKKEPSSSSSLMSMMMMMMKDHLSSSQSSQQLCWSNFWRVLTSLLFLYPHSDLLHCQVTSLTLIPLSPYLFYPLPPYPSPSSLSFSCSCFRCTEFTSLL
jgi:hypothetical protein